MEKPYRLQSVRDGTPEGMIKPSILQFATENDGEAVAERYRAAFPGQTFRVVRVDRAGYVQS